MNNFQPTNLKLFSNIETKNLILRRMGHNDINELFIMRKDPRMNEFTDAKLEESTNDTKIYIDKMNAGIDDNKWYIWAIEHKQSKKLIGSISIWNIDIQEKNGELGYGIIPDFQGMGLMKEALLSVIDFGFNEFLELYAYTEEKNIKSIKLLEKCNFIEVDRKKEDGYYNKKVYNMVVYKLQNANLLK